MNERIRELAVQSNIEFTYDPTETPVRAFAECWEDDLKKFAELIVRECTDMLMLEHAKAKGQHNYYHVTANKLKKHFGVEE